MTLREEIQRLFDLWVARFSAGDLDGAAALYAPDGAIYSPYGDHAEGAEAIRATHAEWAAAGETNKVVRVLRAEGDAAAAWAIAAYSGDHPQPGGGSTTESGVSLNTFRRGPDGGWILCASSLNSDRPPLADAPDHGAP
jgi:uncharacterized protein (TIGR02246 family)